MSDQRVVVIGAGVAGLSCAHQLAAMGCTNVVVLDQSHVAAGSSSLSVGMFTRSYFDPLSIEMRMWSHDYFSFLERTEGLRLRRNGFLRLAHTDEALATLSAGVELQHRMGVRDSQLLDPDQMRGRFQDLLVDDLRGAMYVADDGYLDGAVLCGTYQQLAQRDGVRILSQAKVNAIDVRASSFSVQTGRGHFEADVVVNAAGAWANRIAEMLNAPLGIVPQRHQAVVLRGAHPLPYVMPNVMDYVPGDAREGVYFRHESDAQLVAGIHSNDVHEGELEDPDSFARGGDDGFLETLGHLLARRLANVDDLAVESAWSGLYPMSGDGLPILGEMTSDGVYACAGLGGVGINLSPVAGRLVAEAIVLGSPRSLSDPSRVLASRLGGLVL